MYDIYNEFICFMKTSLMKEDTERHAGRKQKID